MPLLGRKWANYESKKKGNYTKSTHYDQYLRLLKNYLPETYPRHYTLIIIIAKKQLIIVNLLIIFLFSLLLLSSFLKQVNEWGRQDGSTRPHWLQYTLLSLHPSLSIIVGLGSPEARLVGPLVLG